MNLLIAKPVVEAIQDKVHTRVAAFTKKYGLAPKLSVILVGEDPASQIYTRKKGETATKLGMAHETLVLPASSTPEDVRKVVEGLNRDPQVAGILIQRPLPKTFKEEEVVYWIAPAKDVDAFHPENTGRMILGLSALPPCTPAGIMELLTYYKIPVAGKTACVLGRSAIVGKPVASMLLQADATILHCHSKTPDLRGICRQADILVVAIGKPEFVDASFVRDGAVVIDVGVSRKADGKVVGDVLFPEVSKKVSAITPVPGGVGPMTIAVLMQNTISAAENQRLSLAAAQ